MTLVATVLCLKIKVNLTRTETSGQSNRMMLAWISLGAMTFYFFGLNGTWAFLELVGDQLKLNADEIGIALSISLFLDQTKI